VDKIISDLEEGKTMALISDAGTPGISDPGFLLTRAAVAHQLEVEALPGATAFVPALVKSGFPTDRFVFEGFLPQKKGRKTRLKLLADEPRTIVLYESPHRLIKALKDFQTYLEGREVSVSRELTKKFEETKTGQLAEVLAYFESKPSIKGEIVIVLNDKNGS
jgi:16S rRNA (cytidine1402-2'-O)-methyltransferase